MIVNYDLLKIKNPLFRIEKRPDVLDVLYKDCFSVYLNKDEDRDYIYTAKIIELMELTTPTTKQQDQRFEVKLIHEQMDKENLKDSSEDDSDLGAML